MSSAPGDLPKYTDLMPLVLEALEAHGGSASVDELNDWLVDRLDLSQAALELAYEKSGQPVFVTQSAFARSYLKGAGLADTSERGVWTITPEGRNATPELLANVPRIVTQKKRASRKKVGASPPAEEADWKDTLLDHLGKMDPAAFERLCQRILREKGFTKVEVTGRAGDGGIDGQGVLRVNLLSFQVIFQAKRWKGSVGAGVVRDFRGAMVGRADKGLIMTTARFTADASREAVRDGAPAIDLVDGEDFCEILKELRLGVDVKFVESIEILPSQLDEI